eukprot:TRINITY_DN6749_c0_g1_i7.p1 TRINITY_DN6749_c0_g1~~TRINITY_DN6749_c0_g1_i7.p1  ORF type:complete len:164 (-),score=21.61 TRINITY_DN6749_c0_g1_i7:81-542(-)
MQSDSKTQPPKLAPNRNTTQLALTATQRNCQALSLRNTSDRGASLVLARHHSQLSSGEHARKHGDEEDDEEGDEELSPGAHLVLLLLSERVGHLRRCSDDGGNGSGCSTEGNLIAAAGCGWAADEGGAGEEHRSDKRSREHDGGGAGSHGDGG